MHYLFYLLYTNNNTQNAGKHYFPMYECIICFICHANNNTGDAGKIFSPYVNAQFALFTMPLKTYGMQENIIFPHVWMHYLLHLPYQ